VVNVLDTIKLFYFLYKRTIICYLLLAIADILFVTNKWPVLAGLTIGVLLNTIRFGTVAFLLNNITNREKNNEKCLTSEKNIINGRKINNAGIKAANIFITLNHLIFLPMLYFSYLVGLYFFAGMVAGILVIPFIMFINGITEALNITHNNFS